MLRIPRSSVVVACTPPLSPLSPSNKCGMHQPNCPEVLATLSNTRYHRSLLFTLYGHCRSFFSLYHVNLVHYRLSDVIID